MIKEEEKRDIHLWVGLKQKEKRSNSINNIIFRMPTSITHIDASSLGIGSFYNKWGRVVIQIYSNYIQFKNNKSLVLSSTVSLNNIPIIGV